MNEANQKIILSGFQLSNDLDCYEVKPRRLKSVHYQGATIYNKLPPELRVEKSIVVFKNKLRDYYRKT